MSYYDDLDISPTATPDEIKRAYRQKANEHHPDKGGNAAEFARAARAWEVLRNPERKALYDATGKDKQDPIEQIVQNRLLHAFSQVLSMPNDVEILASVRRGFEQGLAEIAEAKKKARSAKKKIAAKRDKVKTTDEVNLVHQLIDQQLRAIDTHLADLKNEDNLNKLCIKALDTYTEEVKKPEPMPITLSDVYWRGADYGR